MTSAAPIVKILLVDDLEGNLVALRALLRGNDREVFCARSGDEALSLMLEHEFALAMLDVQMPGMNGFELAELMRGTERTRHIPIVFVTAAGRELNHAFRGYESGAVDFLYKPLDAHMVRSKVAVFVDLFRQRQALQQAHAELQRAVRMRDDFMSMVSHEMRNPLNTLYLQVQLRKRLIGTGSPPELPTLKTMTDNDERQIHSMIRLLDDILDVSRIRTGRLAMAPCEMDLSALVRRAVEAMSEQARASDTPLGVEAPPHLPIVGDEVRLEQVLTNLLTNALRYGGGRPVQVTLRQQTGEAVISVKDQGPGIAPADQERIFGQFERTSSAGTVQGLGLGLFISQQLVHAHGGRIHVQSAPGKGSEFMVSLPLPPATAGAPRGTA
ncbi:hybrid sensor histidine kinase/response regulator [Ramlibacter sp. AN1015]|uniref:hybrid sensor histidine kinase/response regulator n=1 Tax=Ramlibacter sp. AN1015 TaxID=3133428 RepID=UPI0030C5FE55